MKGGRDRLADGPKAIQTQGRRALMPTGKSANMWYQYPLSPRGHFPSDCFSPLDHLRANQWIQSQAKESLIKVVVGPPGRVLSHLFSCALSQVLFPGPLVVVQPLPPHRHIYTFSHCEICPDFPSLNFSLLNSTLLFTVISLWTTANDNSVELAFSSGFPQPFFQPPSPWWHGSLWVSHRRIEINTLS